MLIFKAYKKIIGVFLGLFCLLQLDAQVVITPTNLQGPFIQLDQLTKVSVSNVSTTAIQGILELRLENKQQEAIISLESLPFQLESGGMASQTDIRWSPDMVLSNRLATRLSKYGGIPTGEYVYCYRFIQIPDRKVLGVFCQEQSNLSMTLPRLSYPSDEAILKTPLPVLNWLPPMPMSRALNYSLRLVELREEQVPMDAIQTNLPLFEKHNLQMLSLSYPPTAINLQPGKKYAWQVTAFWGGNEVGKTEIWEFSIEELRYVEKEAEPESFRMVKSYTDGAQYIFKDKIYFGYQNREFESVLNYSIYPMGKPKDTVENLPKVKLGNGLNKVIIDLKKSFDMSEEEAYMLEIVDRRGGKYFLEFKLIADQPKTLKK